jgi:UDP-sugar transporter A1/2/3
MRASSEHDVELASLQRVIGTKGEFDDNGDLEAFHETAELISANDKHCEKEVSLQFPPTPSLPVENAKVDVDTTGPLIFGLPIKWVSLFGLTLQTTGQAILIRWSKSTGTGVPYLSSTAVFFTETVKVAAALSLVILDSGGLRPASQSLLEHFTRNMPDLLKALVPSLIYTIQNNLIFYSLEKLSAPEQKVLYQMKVVTTAGLGVVMLGKKLTRTQWVSCFMLAAGVAMVQWPRHSKEETVARTVQTVSDKTKGFLAVLAACMTSGFAGV